MTSDKKPHVTFTICNIKYLPKALVLAETYFLYTHQKIIIYICDRPIALDDFSDFAEIKWVSDLEIENLSQLAFRYDITEFSTCLKPHITLELLNCYEKVVFFDPDICLYNSITPILEILDAHSIVLTPHYITPEPDTYSGSDVGMLRFGSFNLGFYAVRKTEDSLAFLNWWNDRCFRFCYFETQFGLSTDQKWVSIAPCFFPDLHISFEPGYNVAFWNVRERSISVTPSGQYVVNGSAPLMFFHFSSFDDDNPTMLTKRPFPAEHTMGDYLRSLCVSYSEKLNKYKLRVAPLPYSFDYMSNGDYISPTLRRAYASVVDELPSDHDPFDSNGPVGRFAKRNYLIEKSQKIYVPSGYNDIGANSRIFKVINTLLRLVLYCIGPNRFSNLSRLMVYLSSYRQNRDLWKL